MPSQPLVFVIIVNWNGKAVTIDCLDSLSHLTYRNTTVVVVDNGSTDGSVNAIRERFPRVVILEMKQNLRFAGGTNAGVRYGLEHGGEMFLLLNNDTTVDPEFLSPLVSRLGSQTRTGLVAPKIYYHDEPNRLWFAGGEISMWTGTMRHSGIRELDNGQHDASRDIEFASGCCMLVKREVIEQVGLLDESYSIYTEDADLCMRVRQNGYTIAYEPRSKIWHKLSSSSGHLSWFKMKHKFFSNLRFFARYASWYHWLVFPWANLLVNCYSGLKYLLVSRRS